MGTGTILYYSAAAMLISLVYKKPDNQHTFNGPFSGILLRDSEWQWHQLGRTQVCTSLQTDIHASTPPLSFFTGRMLFLPPNQRRQSTEGKENLMMIVRYRVNRASGVVSGQDRRERSDTQSDSSSKSDADQFYSSSSTLTPAPTSSGGAAVHGQQPALLFDILVYF